LSDNPFSNAIPAYFYPSVGGYTGVKMAIYQDLIDYAIYEGPRGINLPVLNMLNVKYLSAAQPYDIDGYEVVYQGDDGYVLENQDVLPKAFFVDSLSYATSAREAMDALNEGAFDPSSRAIVETDRRFETGVDAGAQVQLTHYDARRIAMDVSRSNDGFLVLGEIYYPEGWRAWLDDEEVDIIKTNYVLRGIPVPAGEHELYLEFTPRSHFTGSKISWIANILLIAIGFTGFGLYFYSGYSKP
ncbi:MAG: YfhO family protein, partial [Balneolales bacterium]